VLRQEGIEPPIVLWALTREIRTLYAISQGLERGLAYDTICQKERIWGKRKQTLRRCAERLSLSTLENLLKTSQQLDKVIKGMAIGSPWLILSDITITLSGKRLQLTSPV
jgi:DNA polymerase-3 subunit delta